MNKEIGNFRLKVMKRVNNVTTSSYSLQSAFMIWFNTQNHGKKEVSPISILQKKKKFRDIKKAGQKT